MLNFFPAHDGSLTATRGGLRYRAEPRTERAWWCTVTRCGGRHPVANAWLPGETAARAWLEQQVGLVEVRQQRWRRHVFAGAR